MGELREVHYQALAFLAHGPDCIGVIDDEHKLAAAMVFEQLRERGLAVASTTPNGPEYRITRKGATALRGLLSRHPDGGL